MSCLALLLLASVGFELEARGASSEVVAPLTDELRRALEGASGQRLVLEAAPGPGCAGPGRVPCLEERRVRLGHADWVALLVIVGPTRTRVVGERVGATARVWAAEVDLPRSGAPDEDALTAWAARLFPPVALTSGLVSLGDPGALPQEEAQPPSMLVPMVGVGVGVAAIVTALLLDNLRAQAEQELRGPHPLEADPDLVSRRTSYGTAARISAGSGVVVLGASIALLFLQ